MALAGEDSPYWVHSNVEILYVLKDLHKARTALACEFNRGLESFTTEVLGVEAAKGIVLDVPPSQGQMDAALRAGTVIIRTTLRAGVRIEFELDGLSSVKWEGGPALTAPLPRRMLKIQRRNFFRVAVPKSRPINCMIGTPGKEPVPYTVLDLGLGGVALYAIEDPPCLEEGRIYEKCRIDLPQVGVIETRIDVRHITQLRVPNRPVAYRYGCRFDRLPASVESLIQRFVLQLERDRRAAALVDLD